MTKHELLTLLLRLTLRLFNFKFFVYIMFKLTPRAIEIVFHSCNKVIMNPKAEIWPVAVATM